MTKPRKTRECAYCGRRGYAQFTVTSMGQTICSNPITCARRQAQFSAQLRRELDAIARGDD